MIFREILNELGEVFGLTLVPDDHGSCLLTFDDAIEIQIEPDKKEEELIYGIVLGEMGVGKGREAFFRAALMANNNHLPGSGVFAFSRQTNKIVLFDQLPLEGLTGKILAASIELMLEKAKIWGEAMRRGQIPDPNAPND